MNASGTKTFLGARYRRIIKHAPKKKAMVAVARNILEIFPILISRPRRPLHRPRPRLATTGTSTARP